MEINKSEQTAGDNSTQVQAGTVNNYFCVVMLGLTNVNILYYSFSTLYQMCNLRYNHIRVCDFFP